MGEVLFQYKRVDPTTWAYLSSLLAIALFFKFNRFWSVRNFDLLLVILLAPGLLCIKLGLEKNATGADGFGIEMFGYIWLFSVNALLLLRMLLDSAMVRRPLLESNLTVGGLSFLTASLLLFLTANVINGTPEKADIFAAQRAEHVRNVETSDVENRVLETHGPGFTLFFFLPHISTQTVMGNEPVAPAESSDGLGDGFNDGAPGGDASAEQSGDQPPPISTAQRVTAKIMAIFSQMMIVLGMVLVAARHFDNMRMGIAAATLYLLLPYTAMWTGAVTQALPGALLVWAVLWYRRPLVSGALIGALCGSIYYPIFLTPLWIAFYWNRGLARFLIGFGVSIGVLVVVLLFTSFDVTGFRPDVFTDRLTQMFGVFWPRMDDQDGVWHYWNAVYRLPVIMTFLCLSVSFLVWPSQKNLGTLLSCSAALMIGTQFWHAHSGGMALAWCLPVMLLTIFRPNLEDRVAVDVVYGSRGSRTKAS
ncbi:hypothetical protein Pla123a_03700 [Posidoniimonas polymericola]|uniref:Transmembrane protein n=1 Tax=Posidoniimonas polymericola TaxID=2528002 RepID=A0A5C5ZG70_9BACT|nr:hypothetical protein [Posidoniimonas polymericola]TWT85563.1 hypothetical protein Pla123a_03700 [Posidoniimonas polymericola]